MKTTNTSSPKGFSKYSIENGVVKNIATGNIMKTKTGTDKYQLTADNGRRANITLGALEVLLPAKGKVVKKAKETAKPAAAKVKANASISTTENKKTKKHEQCYRLHLEGKSIEQIMEIVGTPKPSTVRNIWFYTSGKKKLND